MLYLGNFIINIDIGFLTNLKEYKKNTIKNMLLNFFFNWFCDLDFNFIGYVACVDLIVGPVILPSVFII